MGNSIRKKIDTSIEALDYNTICRLVQYIRESFSSVDSTESLEFNIQFDMGDITITKDDFNEFCKIAYGQEIDVTNISLSNYHHHTYVHIHPYNHQIEHLASISISCEDIPTLTKMVSGIECRLAANGELLRIKKQRQAKTTPTTTANIPHTQMPQSTQSNITINVGGDFNMSGSAIGDNNEVENKGNVTTTKKIEAKADGKSSFWEGVWQQVVANGVWWILGVIGASILAYLGLA